LPSRRPGGIDPADADAACFEPLEKSSPGKSRSRAGTLLKAPRPGRTPGRRKSQPGRDAAESAEAGENAREEKIAAGQGRC